MDRNEILAKAKSNKKGYEYENSVAVKSGLVDVLAVIAMVIILILAEYHARKTFNLGILAVAMTIISSDCLYMGIRNKKYIRIIIGILSGLFALASAITYINQLVAA